MSKRRIVIDDEFVYVYGFHPDELGGPFANCRTVADECVAWGVKRLGEELERSIRFMRSGGEPTDNIVVD